MYSRTVYSTALVHINIAKILKKSKNNSEEFSRLLHILKADFNSVEFSDWTENPSFMCKNVPLNLNGMLHVRNILIV